MDRSELRRFFPVVMTPSHDGKFFGNYLTSLLNFTAESQRIGMKLQIFVLQGESLITRARNQCVAQFLSHPEWTHLFWIDSDIGFSHQAAFRLLLSGHDIAAGVYPLKLQEWPPQNVPQGATREQFENSQARYPVNCETSADGSRVELRVDPDGFMQVSEAPTGFMVIARSVIERLIAAHPERRYVPDTPGVTDQGLHYRLFDTLVDPKTRRYLSEDYAFCRLWTELGGHIHLDACSNLSHYGSKTYRGNFARSLTENPGRAVGAPTAATIHLQGSQYLSTNEAPSAPV